MQCVFYIEKTRTQNAWTRYNSSRLTNGPAIGRLSGFKIQAFDKLTSILRSIFPIHAAVAEFHGKRIVVTNLIEGANDRFPVNSTPTWRAEFPTPAIISVRQVRTQNTRSPV